MTTPEVRLISSEDKPVYVDPRRVSCGFALVPQNAHAKFPPKYVHQALSTNKTEFWKAAILHNSSIPIHILSSNRPVFKSDATETFVAAATTIVPLLDKIYPNCGVAFDSMSLSFDGGRTLTEIFVGFGWQSVRREVIVAAAHKILPGRTESAAETRSWWKLW